MTTTAADLKVRFTSDTKDAEKGIRQVGKGIDAAANKTKGFASVWASTAGGFIAANLAMQAASFGKNLFGGAISGASDFQESVNKNTEVFGANSAEMIKWSEKSATSFGLSQNEALAATGTLGNLFKGVGIGTDMLPEFSQGIVKAAADLGSFSNIDPTQVLGDLQSGLVGEAEPLRKYGILLNETTVAQKAQEEGIWDGIGAMTEDQKVKARYALIMDQLGDANDDFARTSGGLANKQRILSAQFKDLTADLGKFAIPLATAATGLGIKLVGGLYKAGNALKPFGRLIAAAFKGNFQFNKILGQIPQPLRRLAHGLGVVVEGFSDLVSILRGRLGWNRLPGELRQIWGGIRAIGEELGQAIRWGVNIVIDSAVGLAQGAGNWLWNNKDDIWQGIKDLAGWASDSFKQVVDVAIDIGKVAIEGGKELISGLSLRILAWTQKFHPKLESLGIDVGALSPALAEGAVGNFGAAIKKLVLADPIEITPKIEVNIHDAVENWALGFDPTAIDFSFLNVKFIAITAAMMAAFPMVAGAYIVKTVGPDIAKAISAALSGIWDAITFEQPTALEALNPFGGGDTVNPIVTKFQNWLNGTAAGIMEAIAGWIPDWSGWVAKLMEIKDTAETAIDVLKLWVPDFGFIGDAIQKALDIIPIPTLPGWLSDMGWITEKIAKLTGYISDLLGLSEQVNALTAEARPSYQFLLPTSGSLFDDKVAPNTPVPRDLPTEKQAFAAKIPAPDTSAFDSGMSKVTDALKNIGNNVHKAKLGADNTPFSMVHLVTEKAAQAFANATFESTFDIDNAPAAIVYQNSWNFGMAWDAKTFESTFDIDNGPAAIVYQNSWNMGLAWASQVFTARFSVDTSGITNAVAVAYQAAAAIAAILPHSLAKRGPLSKPVSFRFIPDTMRRDLAGMPDMLANALTGRGRGTLALAGARGNGTVIQNNYILKSDELTRLMKQAEQGGNFARNFPRELHLQGGA